MEIDIHGNNNANNCSDDTDGDKMVIMVILSQNSVHLSDAPLNDLFFSKMCFTKSSTNMLQI